MLNSGARVPMEARFGAEGVCVLESRHRKGFSMEDTAHDFLKVLYPFRGRGWLVLEGRKKPFSAGDVALVPSGVVHRIEDGGGAPLSLYVVCVQSRFLLAIPAACKALECPTIHSQPIWGRDLGGLLRALLIEQSAPTAGSPARVAGLVWQLLGFVWRAGRGEATKMRNLTPRAELARERVAAYARELPHCFHEEGRLEDVATSLGLSRRRFTQLFREIVGESWLQALRRLRVAHAQRLLRETDRSVAAIAFESGFEDLSHFYRVFRQSSPGCSPQAWRGN